MAVVYVTDGSLLLSYHAVLVTTPHRRKPEASTARRVASGPLILPARRRFAGRTRRQRPYRHGQAPRWPHVMPDYRWPVGPRAGRPRSCRRPRRWAEPIGGLIACGNLPMPARADGSGGLSGASGAFGLGGCLALGEAMLDIGDEDERLPADVEVRRPMPALAQAVAVFRSRVVAAEEPRADLGIRDGKRSCRHGWNDLSRAGRVSLDRLGCCVRRSVRPAGDVPVDAHHCASSPTLGR